ncbi:hypothetical protein UFOVP525_23 [uncultured Caudovirales phage]|uniref:Uncharacterized protein n=1 Tax=uncultured Caudovirales phage TaxID=2100421 RepID=A0A6J5MUN2_9CAUD|nr:hypothetical protein UFOVP525_23 [uncultured Caudovirales phage]
MNPTIEVQINARLDQLDAQLKVAEAKISKSAVTMGKTGEKAGANFGESFAANLPMMMVATAISKTIGSGVLAAIKDSHAGKSGEEIGMSLAKGIVDGAKSLPVVGVVVGILDEMINGMDRLAEAAHDRAAAVGNAFRQAFTDIAKASETTLQAVTRKTEDMAAKTDPAQQAKLSTQRTIEDAKAQLQKIEDEKQMLRDNAAAAEAESVKTATQSRDAQKFETFDGNVEGRKNDEKINKELEARKRDAASTRLASEQAINKQSLDLVKALNEQILQAEKTGAADQAKIQQDKVDKAVAAAKSLHEINLKAAIESGDYQGAQKQIDAQAAAEQKALDEKSRKTVMSANEYAAALKEINAKAAADQKALDEKSQKDAKEVGNQMVADFKEQKKEMYDAAMQAQEDIIKGEQAVQKKVDKAKVFSEAVSSAGQGFINSGQTALGQFNFAQQGAGSSAIDMAKKQVASLEKIEQATAEQVRLTKENKGFL